MNKKTIFLGFIVLIACFVLVGCDNNNEENKVETKVIKNVPYVIDLNANQTTGYSWSYKLSLVEEETEEKTETEEEQVEEKPEVKAEDFVEITSEYIEKCPDDGPITGCPGVESYTIKGLKEGKVQVEFSYAFATKKKAAKKTKIATYILQVDKNLNVVEVSHSGSYFEPEE